MKVLVCGSRTWTNKQRILERLSKLSGSTTIIHGGARGADALSGAVASILNLEQQVFLPDWDKYGRSAGFRRNLQMLDECPDLVIAFQLGQSKGTQHTVDQARKRGIPVEVYTF